MTAAAVATECVGPVAIPLDAMRALHTLAQGTCADDFTALAACAWVLASGPSPRSAAARVRVIQGRREAVTPASTAPTGSFRALLSRAGELPVTGAGADEHVDAIVLVSADGARLYVETTTGSADGQAAGWWATRFVRLLADLDPDKAARMFVPGQYRVDEHAWHRRIVAGHPLATLVTNGEPVPYGTRLPALVAPGEPECGPLVGTELYGHLNRANPHWRALRDGTPARLMFDGPNAFVSPSVYHEDPAAPTWDFAVVHLCGSIRPILDAEETLAVVRWTAQRLEQRFGAGWDQSSSVDYFRRMLPAVGAFRLRVESVEAMFKLSQEKDVDVQESVIRRYEADPDGAGRPLAKLMREVGIGHPAIATAATAPGCPF